MARTTRSSGPAPAIAGTPPDIQASKQRRKEAADRKKQAAMGKSPFLPRPSADTDQTASQAPVAPAAGSSFADVAGLQKRLADAQLEAAEWKAKYLAEAARTAQLEAELASAKAQSNTDASKAQKTTTPSPISNTTSPPQTPADSQQQPGMFSRFLKFLRPKPAVTVPAKRTADLNTDHSPESDIDTPSRPLKRLRAQSASELEPPTLPTITNIMPSSTSNLHMKWFREPTQKDLDAKVSLWIRKPFIDEKTGQVSIGPDRQVQIRAHMEEQYRLWDAREHGGRAESEAERYVREYVQRVYNAMIETYGNRLAVRPEKCAGVLRPCPVPLGERLLRQRRGLHNLPTEYQKLPDMPPPRGSFVFTPPTSENTNLQQTQATSASEYITTPPDANVPIEQHQAAGAIPPVTPTGNNADTTHDNPTVTASRSTFAVPDDDSDDDVAMQDAPAPAPTQSTGKRKRPHKPTKPGTFEFPYDDLDEEHESDDDSPIDLGLPDISELPPLHTFQRPDNLRPLTIAAIIWEKRKQVLDAEFKEFCDIRQAKRLKAGEYLTEHDRKYSDKWAFFEQVLVPRRQAFLALKEQEAWELCSPWNPANKPLHKKRRLDGSYSAEISLTPIVPATLTALQAGTPTVTRALAVTSTATPAVQNARDIAATAVTGAPAATSTETPTVQDVAATAVIGAPAMASISTPTVQNAQDVAITAITGTPAVASAAIPTDLKVQSPAATMVTSAPAVISQTPVTPVSEINGAPASIPVTPTPEINGAPASIPVTSATGMNGAPAFISQTPVTSTATNTGNWQQTQLQRKMNEVDKYKPKASSGLRNVTNRLSSSSVASDEADITTPTISAATAQPIGQSRDIFADISNPPTEQNVFLSALNCQLNGHRGIPPKASKKAETSKKVCDAIIKFEQENPQWWITEAGEEEFQKRVTRLFNLDKQYPEGPWRGAVPASFRQ